MNPFGQPLVVLVRLPCFRHQPAEVLAPSQKGLPLSPDPMLFREKVAAAERAGLPPMLWHRQRSLEGPAHFPTP